MVDGRMSVENQARFLFSVFTDPSARLLGPVHAVSVQARLQDQSGPQTQIHPHPGLCRQRGGDLEEGKDDPGGYPL